MGNAIVIETPCSEIMISSENSRSIFGDILSPIEGIIEEALNAFKGPVGEVMNYVLQTTVGQILNQLIDFAEGLLGGLLTGFEVDALLVTEPLRLIPVLAGIIRDEIDIAVAEINSLGSIVDTVVTDYIKLVNAAFSDFKMMNNYAINTSQKIVSKMCSVANSMSTSVKNFQAPFDEYVKPELENINTMLVNYIANLPSMIANGIAYSVADACAVFSDLRDSSMKIIQTLVDACARVATTTIDTLSQQLILGANEARKATDEALGLLERGAVSGAAELAAMPGHVERAMSVAISVGRESTRQALHYVDREAASAQKHLVRVNKGVKSAERAVGKFVHYLDRSGWVIASGIILVLLIMFLLANRDIKKARQLK
jgi:phage-related protein